MKTSLLPHDRPLWESARHVFDAIRGYDDDDAIPESVIQELQALTARTLEQLRGPTHGIITSAAREQFNLTVAQQQSQGMADLSEMLVAGQARLISPRFLEGVDRPVAVLLLDQNFETDEWTILPLSPIDTPMRPGEWLTGWDEPFLRVLCFWNAGRVDGCVLEESQHLQSLGEDELAHCSKLLEAWKSKEPWPATDSARSTSDDEVSEESEDEQTDYMRRLTLVRALRADSATGALSLLSSAGDRNTSSEQTYDLAGFARRLSIKPVTTHAAEVTLSHCKATHAARLVSPVLFTGMGIRYPLQEGLAVRVPTQELALGFWIKVGDFGWASLVGIPN